MRRHVQWLLCAVSLIVTSSAARANADWDDRRHYDPTRLYGGLWLGFGGDIEADRLGDVGDLGKTIGGQVGVDVRLNRIFSLGGEVRIGGFDVDGFDDRNRLIDLDFKPRLYLPLNAPVEIYATVPVGLTIPRLADVDGRGPDENVGWNIGVGPGLNVFLTHGFGLNVEPIWMFHHFGVDGTNGNGDVTVKQFAILINAVLAL
ncbi:MAG TPA: outer membrane beta-barrel protein [Polyangiales bacterium]